MHPSDEELAAYADRDGDGQSTDLQAHIVACEQCRNAVDAAKAFESALSDEDAWAYAEALTNPSVPDEVMNAFRTRAAEDWEATQLVGSIVGDPLAFAWRDFSSKPRYRTAGVVRKLCQDR